VPSSSNQGFRGIEARLKHQFDAGVQTGVQHAALTEGMKERQRRQRDVAARHIDRVTEYARIPHQVVVGQRRALRSTGGARRVDDHRRIGRIGTRDLVITGHRRRALKQVRQAGGRTAQRSGGVDKTHTAGFRGLRGRLMKATPCDHNRRRAVTEDVLELDRTHQGGQRNCGCTRPQCTVINHGKVRHIRHHEGDPMPRPNAFARKQSSALLGEIVQNLDRHHEITAP
jgi:hypothetical protein